MGTAPQPGDTALDPPVASLGVRQLLPEPLPEIELDQVYGGTGRRPLDDRPWVLANVVASVDGSAVIGGRTAALSSPADRRLFHLLRSLADVVLVGATTVRVEGYGPARGPGGPPIAVVSRSLELDWEGTFFTGATTPLVITCSAADPERRRRAEEAAEVVVAGDERVDIGWALTALRHRGAGVVLCEGGPCLLGEVVAAGHVDELCTTIAPLAVAGTGPRVATSAAAANPLALRLASVLEDDGNLFLRYLRI